MPASEVSKELGPFTTPDGKIYKTWATFSSYMGREHPSHDLEKEKEKYLKNETEPEKAEISEVITDIDATDQDLEDLEDIKAKYPGKEIKKIGKSGVPKSLMKICSFQEFHDTFLAIPELINEILNWVSPDSNYIPFVRIWEIDNDEYRADMRLIYKIILVSKPELLYNLDGDGIFSIIMCLIPVLQIYANKGRLTILAVIELKKKKKEDGDTDE